MRCLALELEHYTEQIGAACCAFMGVFKNICELKQIEANVRVAHGVDLQQVLCHEVASLGATKLIMSDRGNLLTVRSRSKTYAELLPAKCTLYFVKQTKLTACRLGKRVKHTGGMGSDIQRLSSLTWQQTVVTNQKELPANAFSGRTVAPRPPHLPPMPPRSSGSHAVTTPNCLSPRGSDSSSSSLETSPRLSPTSVLDSSRNAYPAAAGGFMDLPGVRLRAASSSSLATTSGQGHHHHHPLAGGLGRSQTMPHAPLTVGGPHSALPVTESEDGISSRGRSISAPGARSGPLGANGRPVAPGGGRAEGGGGSDSMWAGTVLDASRKGSRTDSLFEGAGFASGWPQFMTGLASMMTSMGGGAGESHGGAPATGEGGVEGDGEEAARAQQLSASALSFWTGMMGMGSHAASSSSSWLPFLFTQLVAATDNFSEENLIGRGGCSRVYRGSLPDGRAIAVKRLCNKSGREDGREAQAHSQEFDTEVAVIGTVRHRNVVGLLGFCSDGADRMLVYELMPCGNLDENLHDKSKGVMAWGVRHSVALDAARGLEYLHCYAPRPIIHRDIKSSNILLGADFSARVSDFGLARWSEEGEENSCVDVVGTFGYLAPEYFMYGRVNEKTDVYSFGVVLLELISGRFPIDVARPRGEENLVLWAKPRLEGEGGKAKVEELVDPRLEGAYDRAQMERMAHVATLCLRNNATRRPTMRQVVRLLEDDIDATFRGSSCSSQAAAASRRTSSGMDELLGPAGGANSEAARKQFMELVMGGDSSEDDASSAFDRCGSESSFETPYVVEEYLSGRMSPCLSQSTAASDDASVFHDNVGSNKDNLYDVMFPAGHDTAERTPDSERYARRVAARA
eukprot:jgi/Mesen1/4315/ME000022S03607